jgi:hypothetical protein
MRNVYEFPITAEEMIHALDSAIEDRRKNGIQVGDIDAVCLHMIKDMLNENNQASLKRFLDAQPRRVKGNHLAREEVIKLYEDFCIRTGRGDRYVSTVDYRGISKRNSYVYDLCYAYPNRTRLYLRLTPEGWRAEKNEDAFEVPLMSKPVPLPSRDAPEGNASVLGEWLNRLWGRWASPDR